MRTLLSAIFLSALLAAGCAGRKTATPAFTTPAGTKTGPARAGTSATNQTLIVTPDNPLVGRVALVNPEGRFVVLNFPLGKMAAKDQRLSLYRRGLKVGEVKVTGPQREDNIVADLTAGDAEVGDVARAE